MQVRCGGDDRLLSLYANDGGTHLPAQHLVQRIDAESLRRLGLMDHSKFPCVCVY